MPTFSVSFRVMGADLVPGEVSDLLGLKPDEAHRKGDPNIGRSGRRYSDFSEGLWALRSSADEGDPPDRHLSELLARLNGCAALLGELRRQGYRMDVFIGVFGIEGNSGFSIDPEISRKLGELGTKLEFDLYS